MKRSSTDSVCPAEFPQHFLFVFQIPASTLFSLDLIELVIVEPGWSRGSESMLSPQGLVLDDKRLNNQSILKVEVVLFQQAKVSEQKGRIVFFLLELDVR